MIIKFLSKIAKYNKKNKEKKFNNNQIYINKDNKIFTKITKK